MKMKKIATKFSAIVLMAVALTSCNKKTNTPPEADKEVQSAIDASAAQMIATDIDMMVAQASEYASMSFYSHIAGSGSNTVTVFRDTTNKINTLTFNNAKCADGKTRDGIITINYVGTTGATAYIRNPGHVSNVTFTGYKVNNYIVKNGSTFKVTNTTAAGYTRSLTPMTWKIEGELYMADLTAVGVKDISWKGTLNKTLTNSTSFSVHPSASLPIVWTSTNNAVRANAINAIVAYTGTITGLTSADVGTNPPATGFGAGASYTFAIDADKPMTRNFGCSPNFMPNYGDKSQHHPLVGGKVKFHTGAADKAERVIYFGDQENVMGCDNSGIVIINGVSYNVDFRE
jgi:hypothetical protein